MTLKTPAKVEIYYSSSWHDITTDVYVRDPITITRGRQSELGRVSPSTLTLSIKNTSYKYSPRNPTSVLYGLIGRNTPIRVSSTSPSGYRFWGEVESWPQRWTVDGNDVWAPITAYGIMRRLGGTGTQAPAQSPMVRAHLKGALNTGLIAYWPLESGDLREQSSSPSALDGGQAMVAGFAIAAPTRKYGTVGGVTPGPAGAASATDLSGGAQLVGYLPGTSATSLRYEVSFKMDPASTTVWPLTVHYSRGNPNDYINVLANATAIALGWTGPVSGGSSTPAATVWDGAWHHISLTLSSASAGANTAYSLRLDGDVLVTGTIVGFTWRAPAYVRLNATGEVDQMAHCGVWEAGTSNAGLAPFQGHVGETASARITRLCSEEGISCTITGTADTVMGPQQTVSVLDSLYQAADADGGVLFEARGSLGLVMRTNKSYYNQTAALTLNYTGKEVAPGLEPTEDTDHVQNDVTVTRINGGFTRVQQLTGTLNVNEPTTDPQGVGRYAAQSTLNLNEDSQTYQQAGWKRHLGTWDEPRYPVIPMNLTALHQQGKTTLMGNVLSLDVGDRIVVTNPPTWQGPDQIDQVAQGFVEVMESHLWTISANVTPARPYEVGVWGDSVLGRADSNNATLNSSATSSTTSLSVKTTGKRWIDSTNFASQFPFDIRVGGEVMTVTAISGTSSPQTFTVTRHVNGVTKSHTSGTAVRLAHPARMARR